MNVLYLASWFPYPPDNGSRQRTYYLLQGLARHHRVTLFALYDSDQAPEHAQELNSMCARVLSHPRRIFQPTRLRALSAFFSAQPRSIVDTYDAELAARIARQVESDAYDVIVAGELSMAVYAAALQHPAKIFDDVEVGLYAHKFESSRGVTRARNALTWYKLARYLKQLTQQYDAVTVVSASERSHLEKLGILSDKITIVANGVDCAYESAQNFSPKPFTLIYNGALTYSVNLDAMRYFVREILPQIRAVEPRVRLEITGRADQVAQNELSEDNVVSFTGYVQDVRPFVQAAAVCVVPLQHGGGTRLKILEAMALGTPVVATAKGAEGLDVRHGEHLLIADSADEFARATLLILRDGELRARLVRNARARVCAEYDWRAIQERMALVLHRVLEESN